jgi:hypothetical protein
MAGNALQNCKVIGMREFDPAKVLLSKRQYAALKPFTDERSGFVMDSGHALRSIA